MFDLSAHVFDERMKHGHFCGLAIFCRFTVSVIIDNESDQVSKGHLVNALACTGDEGRDTLRKALGSCE